MWKDTEYFKNKGGETAPPLVVFQQWLINHHCDVIVVCVATAVQLLKLPGNIRISNIRFLVTVYSLQLFQICLFLAAPDVAVFCRKSFYFFL